MFIGFLSNKNRYHLFFVFFADSVFPILTGMREYFSIFPYKQKSTYLAHHNQDS